MKKTMMNLLLAAWILAAMAPFLAGCAGDVGEIDRTQINGMEKKDLEGEWYFRSTIVEAPYAVSTAFVGDQKKLERGTFELQKDYLYFYRTYEFVENSAQIGFKADADTPYLAWLPGDEVQYTPNPYQSRDRKFAEGKPLMGTQSGAAVPCADKTPAGEGGMHEFCGEQTGNTNAYCGHETGTPKADRARGNAVCVSPTKYVYRGAPMFAYRIDSHFDVKYEYNPNTGEKTNVLVENTTDRYWYERDYVRVGWGGDRDGSNFHNGNWTFNMEIASDATYPVVSELEAAPDGEQLRIFRDESEKPNYFDYVYKVVLPAGKIWYDYYQEYLPSCLFFPHYVGGIFECSSEEYKIRDAFMKVDPDDDYVPWDYNDWLQDKFGYYREERQYFDELYYSTYTGAIRNIRRFDIWDSHPKKEDGALDYEKMSPAPIVYYLSDGFPREFVPQAVEMARQWSEPFNEVVAFYKGSGAVPPEGMFVMCENNNSTAQAALEAGQPTALFNNPLCKDMDFVKYNGDLRYNFLHAVNQPQSFGPLGFGPMCSDPITGKIITSTAYVYMADMKLWANSTADLIEVMAGYIDYQTYCWARDINMENYPIRVRVASSSVPATVEEAQEKVRGMIRPEVTEELEAFGLEKTDQDWARMRMNLVKQAPEIDRALLFHEFRALFRDPGIMDGGKLTDEQFERMALRSWANRDGFIAWRNEFLKKEASFKDDLSFMDGALLGLAKTWSSRYDNEVCSAISEAMAPKGGTEGAKLAFNMDDFKAVKEPCTKEQEGLIRPEEEAPKLHAWVLYNTEDPAPGDTCTYVDQGGVKGYYWVNTCTVRKLAQQIGYKLELIELGNQWEYWKPSAWWMDTKDPVVAVSQKFVREVAEGIRQEMLDEFLGTSFLSVAIHEVGHNLGLMHNFEASTDAMNFPRDYWSHKVTLSDDKKTYVPVDLFTRETEAQKRASMRAMQYSSIMDYSAKFNSLWLGIGLWDRAAIKFGYGGLLEVFKQAPDMKPWEKYLVEPSEEGMPDEAPPAMIEANPIEELFKRVHYSQIPNFMGSVEAIYDRENIAFADLVGKKCTTDADCGAAGGCAGCTQCRKQLGGAFCSPPEKVEVPYRYCGGEYAFYTPWCSLWDDGADPYEIVRNKVDDYWFYWMVWGHWRGNILFSIDAYDNRVMAAFQAMKLQFQWWAINLLRFDRDSFWRDRFGLPWAEDINGGLTGAMATIEAFSTLFNVFAIPGGGGGWSLYGYNEKTDRYELDSKAQQEGLSKRFVLEEDYGKFAARPMYGGWMINQDEMIQVSGGAIFDRLNAFIALCDPSSFFLNADQVPDMRKYLISFYPFFPDQMLHLLGGLTTYRVENYAACVVEDDNGAPHHIRLRDITNMDDPSFCADGKYLYPEDVDYDFNTTWYRIPLLAAYYGMALMQTTYDRRFMDTTRIFMKGHEDAVELAPDAETIEVGDPMTGKVYVAVKQGEDNAFDAAWYLLSETKKVFDSYTSLEQLMFDYTTGTGPLQRMFNLLELVRSLHKLFDYTSVYGDDISVVLP
jgi:hypothetical protein